MVKVNSGFVVAGSVLLTLLTVGLGLYCLPWGIDDPHSSAGFFALSIYFFIQTLSYAMTANFGETERPTNLVNEFFKGVNKLLAMTMILMNSVTHPQFMGVMFWLGVSLLLLHFGAMNLMHVAYSLWEDYREYRENIDQVKRRVRAEIEITEAMKVEEARIDEKARVESELVSDLADFLADSDSKGLDKP